MFYVTLYADQTLSLMVNILFQSTFTQVFLLNLQATDLRVFVMKRH